jgi:hypothetical protein
MHNSNATDIVVNQTGITDVQQIKDAICRHNGNVLEAVCDLVYGSNVETSKPQPPCFENMNPLEQLREIMREKHGIFQDVAKTYKQSK